MITFESGITYTIEAGVAVDARLTIGVDLSQTDVGTLLDADDLVAAKLVAGNQLSYRPRSTNELRTVLQQRGFRTNIIDQVVDRFTELGYLDDADFARRWIAHRDALAPRGARLLRQELRQKGISADLADEMILGAELDDVETALALATHRLDRLRELDRETQRRRLAQFLERRGFTYETVRKVDRTLFEA